MSEKPSENNNFVDKGDGSSITGDVMTGGGDFLGRDKTIYGDEVYGDKAGGDVINVNVSIQKPSKPIIAPEDQSPADPATIPGEPPFKGLDYFGVADANLFFGREVLIAETVAHLRNYRFLAVIGASGSGKSSLVRAGLIPALQRGEPLMDGTLPPADSKSWHVHIITPTDHPLESLAASLARDSESVMSIATLMDDMARDPRSFHLYVRKLLSRSETTMRSTNNHLLLIVDQFEELFTLCRDKAERKAFVDNLLIASAPSILTKNGDDSDGKGPSIVVITLRADFYAHCAEFNNLRTALERRQKFIGPMNAQELQRAIQEPAQRNGWLFEPGLVDRLIQDVNDEPGALPLLSHALLETWQRRRGHTLTFAGYYASGGVKGAIAQTAETTYKALQNDEQKHIARNIFLRLTELGEGTQDTRRRVKRDELISHLDDKSSIETVLNRLADARLITLFAGEAEVAHEALIREWPALRKWLADNREGLRIQRRLAEAAHEWTALGRNQGALYRGARLEQALEWAQHRAPEMKELERRFLATSATAVGKEQWREGDYKDAQVYFNAAINVAPHLHDPYLQLYQLLVELNEFDQALFVYQCLLANSPTAAFLPLRYRIEKIVGKSEFGIVYQAWDHEQAHGVEVTLSDVKSSVAEETVTRLRTTLTGLQSAHISRVFDLVQEQGRYFIVTESVQGQTLHAHLELFGALSGDKAFLLLDQIAIALEEAHAHNLPHLGLNSTNILLTPIGVKLIRYGETHLIAKLLPARKSLQTHAPSPYLSPEQLAGAPCGKLSDIYALGVLVQELFMGYVPVHGTRTSQFNKDADEALDLLIERARQADPNRRFATMTLMRRELSRIAYVQRPGGLGQTIHWIFGLATRTLAQVRTPVPQSVLLSLLAFAVLAQVLMPIAPLLAVTRLFILVACQVYPASLLFHWQVREIATSAGRVALVQVGRGMGAIFGSLLIIWLLRTITFARQTVNLGQLSGSEFIAFTIVTTLLSLLLVFIVIYSLRILGQVLSKRRQGYRVGFFALFLFWCILIIMNSLLPIKGLIDLPHSR